MSKVKFVNYIIRRKDVQDNPDVLYLFGDNTARKGLGGQAKEMRGEPNTCGICTKRYPSNEEYAFMSDEYFTKNQIIISSDINRAIDMFFKEMYTCIIIPPLGVGLAKLPEKAPKTYEWLQSELKRLEAAINQ